MPETADGAARLDADGVGLMRGEFVALQLGRHPREIVETDGRQAFVGSFCDAMTRVAKAFYPRRVLYRSLDLKTNEYRQLAGGDKHEVNEENPMLGLRGVARYLSRPDEFMLELEAIGAARADGLTNLSLMLPFVRTPQELRRVKELMAPSGLLDEEDFELWAMAEVPAVVFQASEFAREVDGLSIGTNDLGQLLFGVDRDAGHLGSISGTEGNEVLLTAMSLIIDGAHEEGKQVSCCGDLVSRDHVLLERLLAVGLDSVSVMPSAYPAVAAVVADFNERQGR